jgi:hypothetical protein
MAQISFNAANVAPQEAFSVIPAGTYVAQIEESEIKPTKSGTGQMLNLRWKILDGEYKNRVIFQRVNIVNQNPEAEKIGQRQLSGICHAVGVMQLQDTAQLHMKPCKIKVKVRVDETGKYDDSNDVTNVEGIAGGATPATAPTAPAAPWARRAA